MNHGLFLDRDGVLDELVFYPSHGEWESPRNVRELKMRPGVADALKKASAAGWLLFIITNQPSYAKGKCPLEDLQEVHARVLDSLKRDGVTITDDFICYHHPQSKIEGFGACQCRKPSPFFIQQAAKTHDIDLRGSWMVGDQDTDVATGINAGCRTALLSYERSANKRGSRKPDLICAELADFVRKLTAAAPP